MSIIGAILLYIGLPTALLDMGMNGTRHANWAPWGLGMAVLGIVLVQI